MWETFHAEVSARGGVATPFFQEQWGPSLGLWRPGGICMPLVCLWLAAQASGQEMAGLCRGAPADLVALYDDDPMLVGHGDDSRLDALVFSGYRLPIEGVMVHGEWLVVDGEHKSGAATRDAFRAAVATLGVRQ